MKAKIIVLIAVFLVAAGLGKFFGTRGSPFVERRSTNLLDCDSAKVRRIELNAGEMIALERVDNAAEQLFRGRVLDLIRWEMRAPLQHEADAARASKIATLACDTPSPEPLTKAEQKEISFDGVSLHLYYADGAGKKYSLYFSEKAEQRKVFVRVGADGPAYKLPESILQILKLPAASLENRKVARINPGNVLALKAWHKNRPILELERSDSGWILKRGNQILGPGSAEADRYVNRAMNLLALKVYSGGNPCNQREPQFRVDVTGVSGRQEELKFFSGKEGFLVCSSQRSEHFLVHKDFAKYLDVPPKKLM